MSSNEEPLRLPAGYGLFSFKPGQVPAPGGIYLARFAGDYEVLFGSGRELRDREFLLEVDGEQWVATPMPDLFPGGGLGNVTIIDTGGIHAATSGEESTIDFGLLRKSEPSPED